MDRLRQIWCTRRPAPVLPPESGTFGRPCRCASKSRTGCGACNTVIGLILTAPPCSPWRSGGCLEEIFTSLTVNGAPGNRGASSHRTGRRRPGAGRRGRIAPSRPPPATFTDSLLFLAASGSGSQGKGRRGCCGGAMACAHGVGGPRWVPPIPPRCPPPTIERLPPEPAARLNSSREGGHHALVRHTRDLNVDGSARGRLAGGGGGGAERRTWFDGLAGARPDPVEDVVFCGGVRARRHLVLPVLLLAPEARRP